jgi:hypothetical protein
MNAPFQHRPDGPALRQYLTAELRCAVLRVRLLQNEIEAVGVMLANNMITPAEAMDELGAVGALPFVGTIPQAAEVSA